MISSEIQAPWHSFFRNRVPIVVLLIASAIIFLIPFKIVSYGYTPEDDALRHVAKVLSGKSWHEILLIKESIYPEMDTHPGWHFILNVVHNAFNLDGDALVIFSISFLWFLVALTPLFYFKRPEAFITALLLVCVLDFNLIARFLWGRPFNFTVFTVISVLFLWDYLQTQRWPAWPLVSVFILAGLATWIHSTWYLLFLLVFASFFTGRWRPAFLLLGAIVCGVMLGGLLSLHPLKYLLYQVRHLFLFVSGIIKTGMTTPEGRPGIGSPLLVVFVASLLIIQVLNPERKFLNLNHPSFFLMMISWMLGFFIKRFWLDFGIPALIVWLSFAFQDIFETHIKKRALNRLIIVMFLCLSFFQAQTANTKERWSKTPYRHMIYLKNNLNKFESWLPGDGGIVYSNSMGVFYNFFFMFPEAPWRYAQGFEPAIMREEDRAVLYNLWSERNYAAFQPWVGKMTPRDRLIVEADTHRPDLKSLEWIRLPPSYWIGRIPADTEFR